MTLVELGRIVRLQVQRSSLKQGAPRATFYEPEPILSVEAMAVDADGARTQADDGTEIIDVHNRLHPQTKFRGENGLSIGFTAHYTEMRARFGDQLSTGIAGENILIEVDEHIDLAAVEAGVVVQGEDGRRVVLGDVCVAAPCAEFSRFCLNDASAPAREITTVLQFLHHGMRGYYATAEHPAGKQVELRVGDRVFIAAR